MRGWSPPAVGLAALFAVAAPACRQLAPPAPQLDASQLTEGDGSILDGGSIRYPGRPDGGPILPPADVEVVLPYLGDSVQQDLEVASQVGALDVFFSIDTTGSFGGEIENLKSGLQNQLLPELRNRVQDLAVGVGRFEDFPQAPWGAPTDLPFQLLTAITTDDTRVSSAVASLDQPLGNGGDIPEAGAEALWLIATGQGYPNLVAPFAGQTAPGGGDAGGVGFRSDAFRVVVHVTDAPTHEPADYGSTYPDTHSIAEAVNALKALGATGLGIASGMDARPYLETLAVGTGAVAPPTDGACQTGIGGSARAPRDGVCPLVYDVSADGTGLSGTIVDALADLLSTVRYDAVWVEIDDPERFVQSIEAVSADPPAGTPAPTRADQHPAGDGVLDTFLDVRPATQLHFSVTLDNQHIPPESYDQVYHLTLRVVGDGVTLLTRRIRVTVPRGELDAGPPPVPDAAPANPADAGTPSPDGAASPDAS